MKILVLGSNGMAGHTITKYLKIKNYDVTTAARKNADIVFDVESIFSNNVDISTKVKQYDYVINCIGLLVKNSNDNPHQAAIVNSWFPHYLELCLKDSKTRLIHLSTDCVFDGSKGNYIETDVHTEMNFYGRSKSFGEVNNEKDVTFRMSIIGPELKSNGTGLLNWILTTNEDTVTGWSNAFWNGITTLQLAKCIETYMQYPSISGIYHLVNNSNSISKYELLVKINELYNLKKEIIKGLSDKPVNKILIDTKNLINFDIDNYDTQLKEMIEFSK
jgi:dTDP-4-dehydrorhamnose reductase